MNKDPYSILKVNSKASLARIKSAYRELVKLHHPDTGGDATIFLEVKAAWEILKDSNLRKRYDEESQDLLSVQKEARKRGKRNAQASVVANAVHKQTTLEDNDLVLWLQNVYVPIDKLLGQIINPFPLQLKELSADPYDDSLMEAFCMYLEKSQKKIEKVDNIFRSNRTPNSAQDFGLSLYHCLSQVQDALNELERYTMGYVDNYLHDGREMLKEAKTRRIHLHEERRKLKNL